MTGREYEREISRLTAERDAAQARMQYKRGDRIYVINEKVRGQISSTRLESYLIYPETPVRILVKCTSCSAWHSIETVFPTFESARAAMEGGPADEA